MRDVRNIVATIETLDIAYLEHWVNKLGLVELWNEVKASTA
jgi:hypothetical protein